jgi:hypothetical protein
MRKYIWVSVFASFLVPVIGAKPPQEKKGAAEPPPPWAYGFLVPAGAPGGTPNTAGDLAQLERRAQLLAADLDGVRKTHLAVFSGNGRHGAGVAAAIAAGRVSGYSALDVI